ncbi:hypothetical protein CIK06_02165 [Plantactinospora sp. KBS50]|nr:hypothetical protein CIK06_02165 [Plantactinospora sp. KBS50]
MGPAGKPPKDPTDRIPADTIGGWITRGGSGPCYGLVDDDGVEYALHGTGAGTLAVGTRVVATIGPAPADVDCGPGRPVQLRSVRRLT